MLSVKLLRAAVEGSPTSSHAPMRGEEKGERVRERVANTISPLALWKRFRRASFFGPLSHSVVRFFKKNDINVDVV